MTFLPIIARELRVRARSRATYWTRFAVAVGAIVICLQAMGATPLGLPPRLGHFIFNAIVGMAFLLSCSACLLTADAISVERRDGTLGLLFLTNVRTLDLLVGKLGSVGLTSLCALGAFLPVLMLPLLGGGITGGEAFRKGLGLIDVLFLSLGAGLCASAAQKEKGKASRNAAVLLGVLSVVPLLPFVVATRSIQRFLGLLSPVALLVCAGDGPYTLSRWSYWISFAAVQVMAWLLVLGAGLRLRRALAADGGALAPRPRPEPGQASREIGLTRWEPSREEARPIEWLVYRQRGLSAWVWGLAVLALGFSGWFSLGSPAPRVSGASLFWLLALPFETVVALAGAAVVAWVASRFFLSVRRSGELELLMTTPVGAETMAADQVAVLKRFFAWPVVGLQAAMLVPLLAGAGQGGSAVVAGLPFLLAFAFANTWLGVAALCWSGMWFGLKGRTQAGAMLWTVCVAKGVPLLLALFGSVLVAGLAEWFAGLTPGLAFSLQCLPQGLSLVYLLLLIQVARTNVTRILRDGDVPSLDVWQGFREAAGEAGPRLLRLERAFQTGSQSP